MSDRPIDSVTPQIKSETEQAYAEVCGALTELVSVLREHIADRDTDAMGHDDSLYWPPSSCLSAGANLVSAEYLSMIAAAAIYRLARMQDEEPFTVGGLK